jgi:hypothetical protein
MRFGDARVLTGAMLGGVSALPAMNAILEMKQYREIDDLARSGCR